MSPCSLSSILHNQDEKKSPRSLPAEISPCDKLSIQSTCHPVRSVQFRIFKMKRGHPEVILLKFLHVTSCLYSQHVTLFTPLKSIQSRLCWISLVTVYTSHRALVVPTEKKFQAWSSRSPFTDWRCILDLSSQELDWKAWRICWEQSSWWHDMVVLCLVIFLVTFWTPLYGLLDIA